LLREKPRVLESYFWAPRSGNRPGAGLLSLVSACEEEVMPIPASWAARYIQFENA
jgi:hypothetical protein